MIKHSIRNKLILFLLVATLLPLATSIIITYLFTKEKVTEGTIKNNSSLIFQGKTNLTNYLNSIEQATLPIYTNEKLYNTIQSKDIDYLSDKEISSSLQVMSHSMKEVHQIYLYADASNRSYRMINDLPNPSLGRAPEANGSFPPGHDVYFETTHRSSDYGIPLSTFYSPASAVISLHRKIINFPANRVLGELAIDLNLDLIQSICTNLYTPGEDELFILDSAGRIVYGPDPQQWGTMVKEDWGKLAVNNPADQGTFKWTRDHFSGINIFEKMKTDTADWTIIKRIPYEQLYKSARQLTLINTSVLAVFFVIVILCTVYISIRFTAPIKKLIRYITKIQSGNMKVDIDLKRSDELGTLANRFHAMMQNLNQMIMREYRLELANKSNQLRALQAQINPHFLNNTLQSIGTLALQHDAPRIYALISSLAKMMRYSMNTTEATVPLQKELEHVKAYLDLQKQRFEDQLKVEFHIEERTTSIIIPKMIIQPLVENYFKHGFEPRLGIGRLIISAWLDEENGKSVLQISVEDNGKGITDARQLEVRSGFVLEKQEEEGIGLGNVLSRLKLYYDDSARLEMEHASVRGVIIVLTIPLKKEVQP